MTQLAKVRSQSQGTGARGAHMRSPSRRPLSILRQNLHPHHALPREAGWSR